VNHVSLLRRIFQLTPDHIAMFSIFFYTHTWNNFHSYSSFKTKYIMKRFDNSNVSNHSCDNGHDVTAAAPLSWGISVWTYDVTVYIRSRTVQTQTIGPTKLNFCWVIDTSVTGGKIRVSDSEDFRSSKGSRMLTAFRTFLNNL